jgi:hypothetical protein
VTRKWKPIRLADADGAVKRILSLLQGCDGYSLRDAFSLFIEACHLCIDDLPAHFHRAVNGGALTNSPEEMSRWNQAGLDKLDRQSYARFAEAFAILIESTTDESGSLTYVDIVGRVYIEIIGGSRWNSDEFYTPECVAEVMARMTLQDLEREFFQRCKEACENDPVLEAIMLAVGITAMAFDADPSLKDNWFYSAHSIWPYLREKIAPFAICDPAVGSGVLLLRAAKVIPRWLIDMGWVQFFGQDIRLLPVRMTRLNLKLYGIPSVRIKPADLLTAAELASLPSPHSEIYTQLQADQAAGVDNATEIAEVRLEESQMSQMTMPFFDPEVRETAGVYE